MNWTKELIFAHLEGLRQLFSYKRKSSINLDKLRTLSTEAYKSLAFRPKISYIVNKYTDLANYLNSDSINIETIDIFFLSAYVYNGKFPEIDEFYNLPKLKEAIKAIHSDYQSMSKQLDELIEIEKEYKSSPINKFVKKKDLFAVDEHQYSELFNKLQEKAICLYVYAHFIRNDFIKIDYAKIKDIEQYKLNKMAEYVSKISLEEIKF